jgi:ATP-binding cassette, subfamily C (CFTR/MRP), member 1
MVKACDSDGSFGPVVSSDSCRAGFDFTLNFEETVLGLLPHILLLLSTPVRLAALWHRGNRTQRISLLGILKVVRFLCPYSVVSIHLCRQITTSLLTACNIVLLALVVELRSNWTSATLPLASFTFMSSLCILLLSPLEHARTVRPSHFLQFFLLVLLVCDAVRLRSIFLVRYPSAILATASIRLGLTGFLLILESWNKRSLLLSTSDKSLSPEETIGLFGERLFCYLNPIFRQGDF